MNPIYVFVNLRTCRVPPARPLFLTLERAESLLHVKRQRMLERAGCLLHVQALNGAWNLLARCQRDPPELPFRWHFNLVEAVCCRSGPGEHFHPPGQVPQNPSRIAFSTAFQPSLSHLLQIWPWRPIPASWPGVPEPLQNGLFDGISASWLGAPEPLQNGLFDNISA